MDLGILKKVSPRNKWESEARDFTPWLADNIKNLGDALGIELEVENIEVACGPYAADILAKETGSDQFVIIENQLERTNHDHLGKAITYASVLDAHCIIWVATQFSEEHVKALDWLNDHTSDELSFYGVQLELWQVDESRPALRFNVVSQPNEAVRIAAKAKGTDELSESKRLQLEFWTKFKEKLSAIRKGLASHTPRPQYWYDLSLGRTNIHLSATYNTDNDTVGVRVYIRNQIADTMLPYLESKREIIESELGEPLIWNPNPANRDKVIQLLYTTDLSDKIKEAEALNWLVEKTLKFRDVFAKHIATFRALDT